MITEEIVVVRASASAIAGLVAHIHAALIVVVCGALPRCISVRGGRGCGSVVIEGVHAVRGVVGAGGVETEGVQAVRGIVVAGGVGVEGGLSVRGIIVAGGVGIEGGIAVRGVLVAGGVRRRAYTPFAVLL